MSQKPMSNLSEHNIKVATLRFLKAYYKNHEQEGDELIIKNNLEEGEDLIDLHEKSPERYMKAGLDRPGPGVVIIDGLVSFPLEGGKIFWGAFEATSYDKRKELFYQPQPQMLFWDSLSLAAFMSAIIFIGFHVKDIFFLYYFGSFSSIFLGLASFGTIFFAYYQFFKYFSISHYRYIYAIEQFKKYYAQDQWVSFSEDVFPDLSSSYFIELKKQCVKNGVGLIKVDRALNCKFMYTASREEIFDKDRPRIPPKKKNDYSHLRPTTKKASRNKLVLLFNKWFPKNRRIGLLRFEKIPYNQFLGTALSILTIFTFLGIQWFNGPLKYVNEKRYEKKVLRKIKKLNRESLYYIIDTPIKPGEFDDSGLEESDYVVRKIEREIEENLIVPEEQEAKMDKGIIMVDDVDSSKMLFYDCERFANNLGKFYLVTDTIVSSFDLAIERINFLKQHNLKTTALWRGCLLGFDDSYIIYFDDILTDSLEAVSLQNHYWVVDVKRKLGLNPNVTVFIGN